MKLSVSMSVKMCIWYKLLLKLLSLLAIVGVISIETWGRVACGLSGKGYKYRIGKGEWRRMGRNVDYEIIKGMR